MVTYLALMRFRQGVGEINHGFSETVPEHNSPYQTSTIPHDPSPYGDTTYPSDLYQQPPFMGKPEPAGNSNYQPPSYWSKQGPFSRESKKGWLNGLIIWHAAWKEPVRVANESSCVLIGSGIPWNWLVLPVTMKLFFVLAFSDAAFLCFEIVCMFVLPRADYHWFDKWCLNIMQVIVKLLKTVCYCA